MTKKSIVKRIDRHLARRLCEARQESGMSTRKVVGKLPKRLSMVHSTLANYEKGVTVPPVDVLGALADVYLRPLNWFLDSRESLSGFRYRNLRLRSPTMERRRFEALAGKWVEAYVNLEKHLKTQHRGNKSMPSHNGMSPTELSAVVRQILGLDDEQPILNTVSVLESFSAMAMELESSFAIDNATARHGREFVVVFNPIVKNERLRMNAAHELAYLLYEDRKLTDAAIEKYAYTFASSLLLPDSQLSLAFKDKSFLRLIEFKERFGISLAAMIYRAEQSQIINTTASRFLWTEMSRRGWKKEEPGYVWRDRAINFEMILDSAIQRKVLTWADAERVTGVREQDLRQRILEVSCLSTTDTEDERDLYPTTLSFPFSSVVPDST